MYEVIRLSPTEYKYLMHCMAKSREQFDDPMLLMNYRKVFTNIFDLGVVEYLKKLAKYEPIEEIEKQAKEALSNTSLGKDRMARRRKTSR